MPLRISVRWLATAQAICLLLIAIEAVDATAAGAREITTRDPRRVDIEERTDSLRTPEPQVQAGSTQVLEPRNRRRQDPPKKLESPKELPHSFLEGRRTRLLQPVRPTDEQVHALLEKSAAESAGQYAVMHITCEYNVNRSNFYKISSKDKVAIETDEIDVILQQAKINDVAIEAGLVVLLVDGPSPRLDALNLSRSIRNMGAENEFLVVANEPDSMGWIEGNQVIPEISRIGTIENINGAIAQKFSFRRLGSDLFAWIKASKEELLESFVESVRGVFSRTADAQPTSIVAMLRKARGEILRDTGLSSSHLRIELEDYVKNTQYIEGPHLQRSNDSALAF